MKVKKSELYPWKTTAAWPALLMATPSGVPPPSNEVPAVATAFQAWPAPGLVAARHNVFPPPLNGVMLQNTIAAPLLLIVKSK